MIAVTINKRDATADELAAFDNSLAVQAFLAATSSRGRQIGVSLQVIAPGTTHSENAAAKAIEFALKADDGLAFLRLWQHGDFSAIRNEWPEAPQSIFVDADPLLAN